jgi:hypothetical protein
VVPVFAVQPPGLSFRGLDKPRAPVAITVRLVLQELLPRECACVVDDLP